MLRNKLFYTLKPLIPRRLQIFLRRQIARYKRRKYAHIWPIDPSSNKPPEGWTGWPDGKKFALLLCHDVDTKKGYETCLNLAEIEENLGFRSYFNFVPEGYHNSGSVLKELRKRGFEIGVHGLTHDGKLFRSRKIFDQRAIKINDYLKKWNTCGFTSPSMHHKTDWLHALNITHSTSTFDTDPVEPQSDGAATIFPRLIYRKSSGCTASQSATFPEADHYKSNIDRSSRLFSGAAQPPVCYVELPYTLPQDHLLFVILQEKSIDIWKKKLDWIAEQGGMALLNTHTDYMSFEGEKTGSETYPVEYYIEFLEYVKATYAGDYYQSLPSEIARFWNTSFH